MDIMALRVAGFVFLTVSIMHILRVLFKAKITINNFTVPLWLSLVGAIFALLLGIFMFAAIPQ